MLWIFRVISERLKAMFVADVALGLESEFLSRQADRKVELLKRADQLEEQGHGSVAAELRVQAEAISLNSPLGTVMPAFERLQLAHEQAATAPTAAKPVTAAKLEHVPPATSPQGNGAATKPPARKKTSKKRARSR
jgi:hypothetical protein